MAPQDIFLESFVKFLNWLAEQQRIGKITKFRIGEVWRRQVTQNWLLKQGWTHAKHSNHQDFRAADIFIWVDGKRVKNTQEKLADGRWKSAAEIEWIGKYWENIHPNNRWGGHYHSFCDISHFETLEHPR